MTMLLFSELLLSGGALPSPPLPPVTGGGFFTAPFGGNPEGIEKRPEA